MSATATVTAQVHAPVTVRADAGISPSVAAPQRRAYSVRRVVAQVSGGTRRTVFIDFE
ncbi:MAG TPA: hypothetical protein VKV32_06000 [Stellaceae bacterium]|nr:hypothetical protein [Stellaceae bacterium]